jgi:hypothetical protein
MGYRVDEIAEGANGFIKVWLSGVLEANDDYVFQFPL